MGAVSHRSRLMTYLKGCESQKARRAVVVVALVEWMNEDQANRAIDAAIADPKSAITASWGNTIVYWGLENRSTVALYDAVGRVFASYWGPRVFGLKELPDDAGIEVARPSGRGKQDWSTPDLIAFAHPRRKRTASSCREVHSFEIEQHKGFKIQSIYQAYEQGRGANYSWVFAHYDEIPAQFSTAARELGVGVVIFGNPNSFATYSTKKISIMARRRDVPAGHRATFLNRVGLIDRG